MQLALEEAKQALLLREVPVGCILVHGDTIVGRGHNLRETRQNALAHAEILAINEACRSLGRWRLDGCTLYVTLEPCPMCMGAILNARIDRVVFGCFDLKAGCCDSVADFSKMGFNHAPEILAGIREAECSQLLQTFFSQLREGN